MLTPATAWWHLALAAQERLGFSGLFSSLSLYIYFLYIAYIYYADFWDKTPTFQREKCPSSPAAQTTVSRKYQFQVDKSPCCATPPLCYIAVFFLIVHVPGLYNPASMSKWLLTVSLVLFHYNVIYGMLKVYKLLVLDWHFSESRKIAMYTWLRLKWVDCV